MELPIAYYGEAILRKKLAPVEVVTDEIRQFVEDMFETMDKNNGAGLAANQVFTDLRIFVMRMDHYGPDGDIVLGTPYVFINPILLDPSPETNTRQEYCISLPGITGYVTRPNEITVEATDLTGQRFTKRFKGIEARCCMHENDHINGVLMFDRYSQRERNIVESKLRALKKRKKR